MHVRACVQSCARTHTCIHGDGRPRRRPGWLQRCAGLLPTLHPTRRSHELVRHCARACVRAARVRACVRHACPRVCAYARACAIACALRVAAPRLTVPCAHAHAHAGPGQAGPCHACLHRHRELAYAVASCSACTYGWILGRTVASSAVCMQGMGHRLRLDAMCPGGRSAVPEACSHTG